jgi:DNA-binding MarR family transcriptional regulator
LETTVPSPNRTETPLRAEHIREAAASLGAVGDPRNADGAINALAHAVADACVAGDGISMEAAASALRVAAGDWEGKGAEGERAEEVGWAEQRGRLYGAVDLLRWMLQDRSAIASATSVEPGSHAHRMLSLLVSEPGESVRQLNNSEIGKRLGIDKTQVSRVGRELIARGLASTTSLGRKTFWDITPRGRYALDQLGPAHADGHADVPLALVLGGWSDDRAAELAAALATRHEGVTTYCVSKTALGSASGSKNRRGPLMLVDATDGYRSRLADVERDIRAKVRTAVTALEVAVTNGPAFTVSRKRAARRSKRVAEPQSVHA